MNGLKILDIQQLWKNSVFNIWNTELHRSLLVARLITIPHIYQFSEIQYIIRSKRKNFTICTEICLWKRPEFLIRWLKKILWTRDVQPISFDHSI